MSLNQSCMEFLKIQEPESAISRWGRGRRRAAKVFSSFLLVVSDELIMLNDACLFDIYIYSI